MLNRMDAAPEPNAADRELTSALRPRGTDYLRRIDILSKCGWIVEGLLRHGCQVVVLAIMGCSSDWMLAVMNDHLREL